MSYKFFTVEDVPIFFDPENYKIFIPIGDNWIEVVDEDIKNKVRFQSTEISERNAMVLIQKYPFP